MLTLGTIAKMEPGKKQRKSAMRRRNFAENLAIADFSADEKSAVSQFG